MLPLSETKYMYKLHENATINYKLKQSEFYCATESFNEPEKKKKKGGGLLKIVWDKKKKTMSVRKASSAFF